MSDDDPLIIFTPSGIRGHVKAGTTVLAAARELGADLDSVCGGRGICSKCQVTPSFGEFPKFHVSVTEDSLSAFNKVEERYDRIRGLKAGRRLGCQAQVLRDLVVDVPPESQVHKQVVRKAASDRVVAMDPATRLCYVEVVEPDMHEPSGDLERLEAALAREWGAENLEVPLHILRTLQATLRKGEWKVTVALNRARPNERERIIALWPGFFDGPVWGLAIDLGSTTIAAHLCDLATGRVAASRGVMNPQIRFGEDLMSRVSYVMLNPGGEVELTRVVREAIDTLALGLAADQGIGSDLILEAVVVMNPIMHHLFVGMSPVELGQAPFALAAASSLVLDAREIGLPSLNEGARVYILPCIAGHVGADAAAVSLAEAPQDAKDTVLVIDVGTNAEIQLGHEHRVFACSSPTGPALEGAQISSGQRAAPGAIEHVEIDPVTKEPRFRIIGSDLWSDEEGFDRALAENGITGICGSGIIEVLAEMRMAGLMDASGLIGSPEQTGSARMVLQGRTYAYTLHDGTADGGPLILVTQNDVRAIQLAKSALYAGARLLMDKMGVARVDRVVLAGAFGAHISPKHALVLGMFPDVPLDKVINAGNAAGTGARIALASIAARAQADEIVRHIHKIETAIEPNFQDYFVAANAMPHARDAFPELAKVVTLPEVAFGPGGGEGGGGRRRRARHAHHEPHEAAAPDA